MTAPLVRGVLVTHGRLGAELLKTAESILGPQEQMEVVSNVDLSHGELEKRVIAQLSGDRPVVLFVDLSGGSCGHVCAVVRRDFPRVLVARGVNLAMLLEFLHHRHRVGLVELKERILSKGRSEIDCIGWEAEPV